MMAEFDDESFSKTETTKMKKSSMAALVVDDMQQDPNKCEKCRQKPPVCICIDCGGISICKDCERAMHNSGGGSKNRKRHRTKDLSSSKKGEQRQPNGIVEAKLIDFESTFDQEIKLKNPSSSRAAQESFLLVDGSEKLQVRKW